VSGAEDFAASEAPTAPGGLRPLTATEPCPECRVRPLLRFTDAVPPPGSAAEAAAYDACVSPQAGGWGVCAAGPWLLVPSVGLRLYLGPERRLRALGPPADGERRAPRLPPREDDR